MNGLATNRPNYRLPATGYRLPSRGLSDAGGWVTALAGIYQAYQQSVGQGRADDVYVDYLRDQVHLALGAIRFAIRHGGVSPAAALQAGQQVINEFYRETGAMPRQQARQRAENYRSTFEANAALNRSEAEWFYQKWDCPDITTQAQIGSPRCVQLSAPAGTTTTGGGTGTTPVVVNPDGSVSPASGVGASPVAGILDLLGSVQVLGMSIPILPVVAIGLILVLKK